MSFLLYLYKDCLISLFYLELSSKFECFWRIFLLARHTGLRNHFFAFYAMKEIFLLFSTFSYFKKRIYGRRILWRNTRRDCAISRGQLTVVRSRHKICTCESTQMEVGCRYDTSTTHQCDVRICVIECVDCQLMLSK